MYIIIKWAKFDFLRDQPNSGFFWDNPFRIGGNPFTHEVLKTFLEKLFEGAKNRVMGITGEEFIMDISCAITNKLMAGHEDFDR